MATGIVGSLQSLFWALVLLLLIMYMFSVYLLQIAADEFGSDLADPFIGQHYGSMSRMIFSLFKCISGGENWGPIVAPLVTENWMYGMLYALFISFALFAVLNVVTGIFVEGAMESAQRDIENSVIEEMR